jgi:hypothetical protein
MGDKVAAREAAIGAGTELVNVHHSLYYFYVCIIFNHNNKYFVT